MNWGHKIVIGALLFMGYIVFLVTKCMQQDINLVDKHYYKEEIEYQSQIEKLKNAGQSENLSITYASDNLAIEFSDLNTEEIKGEIKLFRPSNDKLDKRIELRPDKSGKQTIATEDLAKGLWRVKVSWTDGKSEFFREEVLVL